MLCFAVKGVLHATNTTQCTRPAHTTETVPILYKYVRYSPSLFGLAFLRRPISYSLSHLFSELSRWKIFTNSSKEIWPSLFVSASFHILSNAASE